MPRTIEIIEHAEELADRFDDHEPHAPSIKDATALRELRDAFLARAEAEQRVTKAVEKARAAGHSWASIGAMVGTSGEAARQRYGQKSAKSWREQRHEASPPLALTTCGEGEQE